MSSLRKPITGLPRLIIISVICGLFGAFVASQFNPLPLVPKTQRVPAPHRIPKIAGGTALRFAMVHDVVNERYLRHGTAWYARRNLDAKQTIARFEPKSGEKPSIEYLDAMDDLAVGLSRTGQMDDAITLMQKKLVIVSPLPDPPTSRPSFARNDVPKRDAFDFEDAIRLEDARGISAWQHQQYTALANLGTIQLLKLLPDVLHAKPTPADVASLRECLQDIEQAIAINPAGHFGREVWQAILIEHLLAGIEHPELIERYDFIGQKLESRGEDAHEAFISRIYGRRASTTPDANLDLSSRVEARLTITRIGADPDWATFVQPDYPIPMPFDESALAIVGMWTLGGGPNPHFALALGRIMESIGQNEVAWDAYQRAIDMQDDLWPDPAVKAATVAAILKRQAGLRSFDENQIRARHTAELAWGLAYQKAYWNFEAKQVSAGVPLTQPDFYKAFFDTHPPIASDPGLSDDVIITHREATTLSDYAPCSVIGAGVGLMLSAFLPSRRSSSTKH